MTDYAYVTKWSAPMKEQYRLDDFHAFSESYKLKTGESVADEWPEDERLEVTDGYGKYNADQDWVRCFAGVPVVTARAREILQGEFGEQVEFLPVSVVGKTDEMYVLNILNAIEFIDYDETEGEENSIDPSVISWIDGEITPKEGSVGDLTIFRDARFRAGIFMTQAAAERVEAAGVKGFAFDELSEFAMDTF